MCKKAFEQDLGLLWPVPNQYKTQKMFDKAVKEDSCLLEYVPDWFVKQQHIDLWDDNDDYFGDDKLIEWYEGHKKRKGQNALIKEELLPIAWDPNHVILLVHVRRREEVLEVTDICFKKIIWYAKIKNVLNKHDQSDLR